MPSVTYPVCEELICHKFFSDPINVINYSLQVIRFTVAIIILLLGLKMDKDFMRSITFTIFIAMTIREVFALYLDWSYYYILFSPNVSVAVTTHGKLLGWTTNLHNVFNLYIHYNTLLMNILLLHCCRLAYAYGDMISPFPVNTLCLVLQVVPFFLSALNYQGTSAVANMMVNVVSHIVTVGGFGILTVQIIMAFPLLTKPLPYAHSASCDIQLQDARSRFAWALVYMVVPYFSLIPSTVAGVLWIITLGDTEDPDMMRVQGVAEIIAQEIYLYNLTWTVAITVAFLPPYRRAVPLLFCCCSCCPTVEVDPVPRKPAETSMMYKYADI